MKNTKTEWYPALVKPVREGWYEVEGLFTERPAGGVVLRKWADGCWWWLDWAGYLTRAAVSPRHDKWRGLTRPVKARKEPT